MDYLYEGIIRAFQLIFSLDPEVMEVVFTSLRVSLAAIFLAALVGIPLGILIGINDFRGKRPVIVILNTLLALPTVVVGLFVYSFISRRGPLGFLDLLFTPNAMSIGQFILVSPIVTALTISAVQGIEARIRETALTLGARGWQVAARIIVEARFQVLAAVITGFGRAIAEIGAAVILGGNIKGFTRTITTAIALEHSKGEFGFALALGFILLAVALGINILLQYLQGYKK